MRRAVERLIEPREDSLRIYRLCGHNQQKVDIGGLGVRSEDADVYVA